MPLTTKQQRFVEEYLVDLNATAAAARAGYKQPNQQGPRLLVNVGVASAIAEAQQQRSERTGVTADRVIEELARLAFSNMTDFTTWGPNGVALINSANLPADRARCVAEVSQTTSESGGSIRFKLHSKTNALELLGKHLGMFKNKVDVEIKGPPYKVYVGFDPESV